MLCVPWASAAIACAPPTQKISSMPASPAAASTSASSLPSGAGTHMTKRGTPRGDIGDDRARLLDDVLGRLPLGKQKSLKALGKIRRIGVEADRHRVSRGKAGPCRPQGGSVNPGPITH